MTLIERDNSCTALKETGRGTVRSMLGPLGTEVAPVHTPVTHFQPIGIGWEVLLKILANVTRLHIPILKTFFGDAFLNQDISYTHIKGCFIFILPNRPQS